MATKEKTLSDAFYETLKDVFYAEKQSVRALKKSAKAAKSDELVQAFETHAEESAAQVERLQQVFEIIGKPARAKTCEAMQGLTSEMEEDLEDFGDSPAADAVLIGCAQAIEHYEIARYGLLKTWARQLGHDDAAKLLDETLQEEKRTDELLSQLSESINAEGEGGADDDGSGGCGTVKETGAQVKLRPAIASGLNGFSPPADVKASGKTRLGLLVSKHLTADENNPREPFPFEDLSPASRERHGIRHRPKREFPAEDDKDALLRYLATLTHNPAFGHSDWIIVTRA